MVLVAGKGLAKEHAQRWNSDLKSRRKATQDSVVAGADSAISARVAEACNRVLGEKVTEEEEISRRDLASAAKERELGAWNHFEVLKPFKEGRPPKPVVDTLWVIP